MKYPGKTPPEYDDGVCMVIDPVVLKLDNTHTVIDSGGVTGCI
jgi:hypothetical protein